MRVKGYFSIRCSDVVEEDTIYTETLNELDGFILPIEYKSTSGSLTLKIASNEKQTTQVELLEKFRFPCNTLVYVAFPEIVAFPENWTV
ncbi:hypothetical protein [Carboxylicivirga marina]|uniref:hypothetical protein n=1 Tax=Carboxylicivirga marina TaxID=2800988 RepID=UPI0025926E75|nr:hypothetical protein [uncultured Carboxylicivirga sp.]